MMLLVAYARSWRLALAVSAILPCIVITGGVMNKFVSKYMQCVYFSLQLFLNLPFSTRPRLVAYGMFSFIVFKFCSLYLKTLLLLPPFSVL